MTVPDPGLLNVAYYIGAPATASIVTVSAMLYFQRKNDKNNNGYARSGSVMELEEKVDVVAKDIVQIKTALLGIEGSGGGLVSRVHALEQWRLGQSDRD